MTFSMVIMSRKFVRSYQAICSVSIDKLSHILFYVGGNPDSKVHGANMGPTRVLLAPGGPHVGPMNLATRVVLFRARISTAV